MSSVAQPDKPVPPSIQLDYGVTRRRDPRRLIRWSLGAAVLLAACVFGLRAAYHQFRYGDRDGVSAALATAVPDGYFDVGGDDEGSGVWEVYEAFVSVDRSRTKTFVLDDPTPADLRRGTHLHVIYFGDYAFTVWTPAGERMVGIDLGHHGVFGNLVAPEIKDIKDLARRYDEVLQAISRLPPAGTHTSKEGKSYRYEIRHRK